MALQFEDLAASLGRMREEGIRVPKVQLSAALRIAGGPNITPRLRDFCDPVYLHQVKRRAAGGGVDSCRDLADALAAGPGAQGEWRVHFHVPLYFGGDAELKSTRDALDDEFLRAVGGGATEHLEIETYTFSVLPECVGALDLTASVAEEYRWVMRRMAEAKARGAGHPRREHKP